MWGLAAWHPTTTHTHTRTHTHTQHKTLTPLLPLPHPGRLILFLQQSSVEWASSLWLNVVQEVDPTFQRTVFVASKFDNRLKEFAERWGRWGPRCPVPWGANGGDLTTGSKS